MSGSRRVEPIEHPVDAVVNVPGSKSIANRALACAAIADGRSVLTNVPDGDDTVAMLACVRRLGLDVEHAADRVEVDGTGGRWARGPITLECGLAGTTSRFLTALAALGDDPITIDGEPPLRSRPFGPLHTALAGLGVDVATGVESGRLPATITGPPQRGEASIRGDVSSQFVTALMLIGPLLPGGLRLSLSTPLVSRPYVELTATVQHRFGIEGIVVDRDRIVVLPGAYRAARLPIEPDASSAGYPLAIAALVGGTVTVPGLGNGALQGDARFADLLAGMGCTVERTSDAVSVTGADELEGIDVDMADISDLVPTMAVVAACASTPSRIRGVGFIRAKESDRLGDLTHELRQAGVDLDETDDGLAIRPSRERLRPARLATHHDHRLAMAFAVLGSAHSGIEIGDPEVVSKSWPSFWSMLDGLRS